MTLEEDFWAKLVQIQAESIVWIPLDEGAYLQVGSDEAVIPNSNGLNLKAYRISDDIPWNQAGARHLGCFIAESQWVLFLDIDQLPLENCVQLILKSIQDLELSCMYYFYVEEFIDSNLNKKLDVHPNTFLANMHRFKSTLLLDQKKLQLNLNP